MTIQERITEIEALSDFLASRQEVVRMKANCALVTIDYWLKRTRGGKKHAELKTERYVVQNYNTPEEDIWEDDINIVGMTRSKKW